MKSVELKTKIRRLKYKISHDFLTLNNIVIFVAGAIALGWVWGSIAAMQENYVLQQELDMKRRDKLVAEIQFQTLEYEQKYLKSQEYQEIAARAKFGLVNPGERVLILPENNLPDDEAQNNPVQVNMQEESNFRQWINFLFGGNVQRG